MKIKNLLFGIGILCAGAIFMDATAQEKSQIEIFQLAAEPNIDGVLDAVWEAMPVNSVNQLEAGGARDGNADYDPTFRAGWKNNKLFFFFDIKDNVHISVPTANSWWQDYVIVFMNFNSTHTTDQAYGDFPAWWLRTTYPAEGQEPKVDGRGPTGWYGADDFPTVDFAYKIVSGGYILEIVFDLNDANWEVPQALAEGVTFGFDIEAGDVDEVPVDTDPRKHQLFWSKDGNDGGWDDLTALGVATIRDKIPGEVVTDKSLIEIFQLAAEPNIDGVLDAVWEAMPVNSVNQLEAGGSRDGNTDYDPTFRAGWKNNKLFFFFDVKDDVHISVPTANSWWQDYVIVFMNFNSTHTTDQAYGDFPAWWLRTTFPEEGQEPKVDGRGPTGWYGADDFPTVDFAYKIVSGGYILEIVFDLNDANWEVPQALAEGVTFGFDIEAGDVDEVPAGSDPRKHQLFWSKDGNDGGWDDLTALGVAVVRNEILETSITNTTLEAGVKMYPNPAQNTLYFRNIESVNRIIISNITGQIVKVVDAKNSSSVDISELNTGMYLVTFEGSTVSTQKLIIR
jgi:hypothetical protein